MTINKKLTKDHVYRMSLSGFISAAAVVSILWVFAEPVIIASVSASMTSKINDAVHQQVSPINNAFVALLQRDIDNTRRTVAALKFRQRKQDNWTEADAKYLEELNIELDALIKAIDALKGK